MPNQKTSKGKKSRRTNSSGDEQENGACAAATGGATAAAAAPTNERSSESQCATPLGCSLGRPIDMDKDDYQRVLCNNELCPHGTGCTCSVSTSGRAPSWSSSTASAARAPGTRSSAGKTCGPKRTRTGIRSNACRTTARRSRRRGVWGGWGLPRVQARAAWTKAKRQSYRSQVNSLREVRTCLATINGETELYRERCSRGLPIGGTLPKSPCESSPGQSPPTGFCFSPTLASAQGAGMRGPRQLGEFLRTAVQHSDRRHPLVSLGRGGGHLDAGSVLPIPMSLALPLHHRLGSGGDVGGHPVQFLRRLDLSELIAHIPRHKLNTYHVRMEDDAQAGQGEELRRFILSALSACQRNMVHCALCLRSLPVFEQFPLVDGTLFLSPSRHEEIEYDVPCHLQGRLMHLYAICVDCLEGVHKIVCIKCKSRWDGSWHQLGTMYTYDILAASPCCQARLNCKHCGKPVVDVRVGMQYFSEYSNVQQCPHCGNLDYHFVKPFSSYKVLEAY
ncbi:hypothetical protein WMY93_015572 [Mugilogobius chulae]|uniref:Headcase middle domain-containing protein n=1 Tax=Mugilogobius chulae TaxID=88201 RepID=A0AAW0P1T3_9GOBI